MKNIQGNAQLSDLTVLADYSQASEPSPISDAGKYVDSLYEDLIKTGAIVIPTPLSDTIITLAGIDEIITEENYYELMRMMKHVGASESYEANNLLDALRQVHAIPMIEEAVEKLPKAA